jgi:predicted metalloprotease with PDZ domain
MGADGEDAPSRPHRFATLGSGDPLMTHMFKSLSLGLAGLLALAGPVARVDAAAPGPTGPTGPISVSVDLRDAPRRIVHATMTIPVSPGPLTLVYPRWIPGDHLPSGPIENLAGLRLSAAGQRIAWTRDPIDADRFHLVIPAGVTLLDVRFDYLVEPLLRGDVNDVGNATTANLAILRWHTVLLYPHGRRSSDILFKADVRLPAGWTMATAPQPVAQQGEATSLPVMTLERLVDSPVIAGRYLKSYDLGRLGAAPVAISLVGDDPATITLSDRQSGIMTAVVGQTQALFGSVVFDRYRFLMSLSDRIRARGGAGGQEHHESSDNTGVANLFADPGDNDWAALLAHEFAHAWNGKYRRPIGETTPDYQQPYDNALLWVYEGLTSYLGDIVAARAGATSPEAFRTRLATLATDAAHGSGRRWRSLGDTGVGLTALMYAGPAGANWRRGADYYSEGSLLWLEIDLKIRALSGDTRSLDDVCHAFFAKDGARDPLVKPYDRAALVAALNAVARYDWDRYLADRVDGVDTTLPQDLFRDAGWSLNHGVVADGAPLDRRALLYALGFTVADDGVVGDIETGGPADIAGLAPGMRVLTVDTAVFDRAALRRAIASGAPVTLLVANGTPTTTLRLDNPRGLRMPRLVRRDGVDRLAAIVAPRATPMLAPAR